MRFKRIHAIIICTGLAVGHVGLAQSVLMQASRDGRPPIELEARSLSSHEVLLRWKDKVPGKVDYLQYCRGFGNDAWDYIYKCLHTR